MFRFTLFNGITLFIFTLTVLIAVLRLKRPKTNWSVPYYAVVAVYTFAFDGSLNRWWLLGGVVCGAVVQFEIARGKAGLAARAIEMLFFGYVLLRSVELVLMWPW